MTQDNSDDAQSAAASELHFGPFRLDAIGQLWRGDQPVDIRPRPLAMLRYFAERPRQLLTKEELLQQLWPGIYVSPVVVRVCVREIRHALGDEATQPQFIQTVGGQGYRFVAPLVTAAQVSSFKFQVPSSELQTPSAESQGQSQQLTTDNCQLTSSGVSTSWHSCRTGTSTCGRASDTSSLSRARLASARRHWWITFLRKYR